MPNRTRTAIEAEIAALQAELAATKPDKLEFRSISNAAPLSFTARPDQYLTVIQGNGARWRYSPANARALRDWLNYHYA